MAGYAQSPIMFEVAGYAHEVHFFFFFTPHAAAKDTPERIQRRWTRSVREAWAGRAGPGHQAGSAGPGQKSPGRAGST